MSEFSQFSEFSEFSDPSPFFVYINYLSKDVLFKVQLPTSEKIALFALMKSPLKMMKMLFISS